MADEFERCWPWLEASIKIYGDTHRRDDVWRAIESGRAFFHPLRRAAVVGNIISHPTGLRDANAWLAGAQFGGLSEIVRAVPTLEAWARDKYCHRAVLTGRSEWKLALGDQWREVGTRLAKDLTG